MEFFTFYIYELSYESLWNGITNLDFQKNPLR